MTSPAAIIKKVRTTNSIFREFLAEFVGTFILVFFGDGSVAQVVLSTSLGDVKGNFFTINWGYGMAVTLAILVTGGVSGAHINPAVTTTMALVGKFPWQKMFHYMLAQYLGAFVGAAMVYFVYVDAFREYGDVYNGTDLKTAGIFSTFPAEHLTNAGGFLDQVMGTAMLLLCVLAITDPVNMKVQPQMVPLYIGLVVFNIGVCLGFNCGYAINPARDLGPRIFSAIAGWGGEVFSTKSGWAWIPVVATHVGGALGGLIYSFFVENHWPRAKDGEEVANQHAVADEEARRDDK